MQITKRLVSSREWHSCAKGILSHVLMISKAEPLGPGCNVKGCCGSLHLFVL